MPIRLKKQIEVRGVFDIKQKYPERTVVNETEVDDRLIGRSRSNMQKWKSVERKTDWYTRKGATSPDTQLSADQDSIYSLLSSRRNTQRVASMISRVPRSPIQLDSRRTKEKTTITSFKVQGTVNTPDSLGPGSYPPRSDFDGNSHIPSPEWSVMKERTMDWWMNKTAAPSQYVDLTLFPSRNKVGGKDSILWPLLEDENGSIITNDPYEYIRTMSRENSRPGSHSGSRAPSRSGLRPAARAVLAGQLLGSRLRVGPDQAS